MAIIEYRLYKEFNLDPLTSEGVYYSVQSCWHKKGDEHGRRFQEKFYPGCAGFLGWIGDWQEVEVSREMIEVT